MFKFGSPLVEGLIKGRPNRFIMETLVDGKIHRCYCPVTGKIGDVEFINIPCLLSLPGAVMFGKSKKSASTSVPARKTAFTVEAISLDSPKTLTKRWIGINQTRVNDYVDQCLRAGQLCKIFPQGVVQVEREVCVDKSRIDFRVNGTDLFEVKAPLGGISQEDPFGTHVAAPDSPAARRSMDHGRLMKHFSTLTDAKTCVARSIFLLTFMYNAPIFDPQPDPTDADAYRQVHAAAQHARKLGVEFWQANLSVNREGIRLIDHFPMPSPR